MFKLFIYLEIIFLWCDVGDIIIFSNMWIAIFPTAFIVNSILFPTNLKCHLYYIMVYYISICLFIFLLKKSIHRSETLFFGTDSLIISLQVPYSLIIFNIDSTNLPIIVQFHNFLGYSWIFIFPWTLDVSVCQVRKGLVFLLNYIELINYFDTNFLP